MSQKREKSPAPTASAVWTDGLSVVPVTSLDLLTDLPAVLQLGGVR